MIDAEQILRDLIEKIAREENYTKYEVDIKPINSGGANYTSVLFLVTIKHLDKEDVELFAKVACIGKNLRELWTATRLYYLEAFFYTKLSKIYKSLELKQGLADQDKFIIPKFYGCNTKLFEETVVLQNMAVEGYGSYNRFMSVDWEHAASSIETLAKFHALSFAYQKDNPEEFEKVWKDLILLERKSDEKTIEVRAQFAERALGLVKEEYKGKIVRLLEKVGEDDIWKYKRPLWTKAIVHGDYRLSNLLYKQQGDKIHTIPIDYQTIHVGSPASDFMYFELCGTDSAFRAEYHDRLLDHYYAELSAAMKRLGVDATEVYPREVLDSEMKEMMPYSVILGMFLLPIVLVEEEQAPRVDGDTGVESFIIPSTDLFADRFRGIVEDCVRWGYL